RVKRAQSGMVVDPVTIGPDQVLRDALDLLRANRITGAPVVDEGGRPLGILTNRDVRFARQLDQKVGDLMTRALITVPEGIALERAKELLHEHRIEKLVVVDGTGRLRGLITIRDIEQA